MSKVIGAVFSIKDQFSSQAKKIIDVTKKSESAVKKAGNELKSFGKLKAKPVIELHDKATNKVNSVKENIKSVVKTKVQPVIDLKDKASNKLENVKTKIKDAVKVRHDIILDLKDRASSKFSQITSRFKENSIISKVADKIAESAKRSEKALNDSGNAAKNFGDNTNNGFQKAAIGAKSLITAIGITKVLSGAFNLVKGSLESAFNRIDVMESFERVMTTLTGSSQKAEAALKATSEAVTGTAYGMDVAAKGVQDFVTRGMEITKATDVIGAWGDAVAFYGDGSNQQLESVSNALAKMVSKGKVDMDQMNTLYDAGIDGVGMYAKATGKSTEDVQKNLSSGAITATDFIDTVTTAMMEGTNGVEKIKGAAKEAGASWGAAFDNMKAAVARGTISIIQSIDEMLVSNGLPDMRDMIGQFGKKFESVLKGVADKIPIVSGHIQDMYNKIKDTGAIDVAVNIVQVAFEKLKDAIDFVKGHMDVMIPAIVGAVTIAFPLIQDAVMTGLNVIREFWIEHGESIMETVRNTFELIKNIVLIALAVLTGVVVVAVTGIKIIWDMFGKDIVNIVKIAWTYVEERVKGALKVTEGIIDVAMGLITGNWSRAWKGLGKIVSGTWDEITAAIKAGVNLAIGLVNSLIDAINGIRLPEWLGGRGLNIPNIPTVGGRQAANIQNTRGIQQLATGTNFWEGGIVQVHEEGGEIIDLPTGSRVYPHDESVSMAREQGRKETKSRGDTNIEINIHGMTIREEADIDKVAEKIVKNIKDTDNNTP